MLLIAFLCLLDCKRYRKNKAAARKEPKKPSKDKYVTQIITRCTRCGLFGDYDNLKQVLATVCPTKYKMSKGIVNKYFGDKILGNVERYRNPSGDTESCEDIFENISLLMPDITNETVVNIEEILLKKLNESVLQVNKNAISAVYKIEEIIQECFISLSQKFKMSFENTRNRLLISILQFVDNPDENVYIKVWGSIENFVIDTNSASSSFNALFYFEIRKKKERILQELVEILDSFALSLQKEIHNLDDNKQLLGLEQSPKHLLELKLCNFDKDMLEALQVYFDEFFDNCKNILKFITQRFLDLQGFEDDTEIENFISKEIDEHKKVANSMINDEISYANDAIIAVVDDMLDGTKEIVTETLHTLITKTEEVQYEIVNNKIDTVDYKTLQEIEGLLDNYLKN